jgi:hypothetical protein
MQTRRQPLSLAPLKIECRRCANARFSTDFRLLRPDFPLPYASTVMLAMSLH